jgi:lysylphosphatidylglycerol synthetase-like protein (DUF2156 family)
MGKKATPQKTFHINLLIGMIVGATLCIAGLIFTILGLSGSIEWVFESSGTVSRLTNASPGVFFGLLGFLLVWRFKPRIKETSYSKTTELAEDAIRTTDDSVKPIAVRREETTIEYGERDYTKTNNPRMDQN